jgi:hypothetical protein
MDDDTPQRMTSVNLLRYTEFIGTLIMKVRFSKTIYEKYRANISDQTCPKHGKTRLVPITSTDSTCTKCGDINPECMEKKCKNCNTHQPPFKLLVVCVSCISEAMLNRMNIDKRVLDAIPNMEDYIHKALPTDAIVQKRIVDVQLDRIARPLNKKFFKQVKRRVMHLSNERLAEYLHLSQQPLHVHTNIAASVYLTISQLMVVKHGMYSGTNTKIPLPKRPKTK